MDTLMWYILFGTALVVAAVLSRGQPHWFAAFALVFAVLAVVLYRTLMPLVTAAPF